MNRRAASILMRGQIPVREPEQVHKADEERRSDFSRYRTSKPETSRPGEPQPSQQDTRDEQVKHQPIRVEKKVGRNDPCPCGSGKKYKNCHGREE